MYKGKITNRTSLSETWKSVQPSERNYSSTTSYNIGVDDNGTLTWNIEASFIVYSDYKSHSGACLTLGHGTVLSISAKQKINTKSSTEAELYGVDDAMTFVMWMKHFFESQVRSMRCLYPRP